jgi:hypothetical protein
MVAFLKRPGSRHLQELYFRSVMGACTSIIIQTKPASSIECRESMLFQLFLMEHVDWRRCCSWKRDLRGSILLL